MGSAVGPWELLEQQVAMDRDPVQVPGVSA